MPTVRLLLGDCLLRMSDIQDHTVDMIYTDLPYGTTKNFWDNKLDLSTLWQEYRRVLKDDGVIVLHATQPFTSELVMSQPRLFRYEWIWHKANTTNAFNAKIQPMRNHESILVFSRHKPKYNPQGLIKIDKTIVKNGIKFTPSYDPGEAYGEYIQEYTNYPKSILRNSVGIKERYHATQKPEWLCEYMIKTYTDEGELILDSCMGSGTAGVAAIRHGRRFIGIELDKSMFTVAKNRIQSELAAHKLGRKQGGDS